MNLFYNDAYIKEWDTEIHSIEEKEGKILVTLKETAFYPEGGGQPSDTGWINGIEVRYVYEENGQIYHVLEEPIPEGLALCRIDFNRRFDHMQQHSGQHLLSAILQDEYNIATLGFHLGEETVTIDVDSQNIKNEVILEIEDKVNDIIFKNLPLKSYIILKEDIDKLPLRKAPSVEEDIRIVEIEGIDYSPCCGTHVSSTGEIGIIKIIKVEKYKSMSRLYFKCGRRALVDFKKKNKIVLDLVKHYGVEEDSIIERAKKESTSIKDYLKEIKELKEFVSKEEAEKLLNYCSGNIIFKEFSNKDFEEINFIGKALIENKKVVAILTSEVDKKILFLRQDSIDLDCGKLFKENIKAFNGKGGGGPKLAQGSFESIEDLSDFANKIFSVISANF